MAITDAFVIIGSSNNYSDYLNATDFDLDDLSEYQDTDVFKMFAVTGIKPLKSDIETTKKVSGAIRTSRYRDDLYRIIYQPFYVNKSDAPNTHKDLLYMDDVILKRKYIWIEIANLGRIGVSEPPSAPGDPDETNFWGYGTLQKHRIMVELFSKSDGENFDKGYDELTQTWQVVPAEE